ncbi:MAG: metal ABC transporter permease [Chlamydiota bacterium]|nr:metal ABC transporter permease [Chlamydiota bacterium]
MPIFAYFNPYYDQTLLGFFWQLFIRLSGFLSGQIPLADIATDEVQILVLIGVASSSALVGSFLILRKMSMLANSISHTILVGIVIAFILTREGFIGESSHHEAINIEVMLIASLIMGVLTSVLTEFLTKTVRLQEDASTGLVFTTLFALGIILVTVLTRNAHIGAEIVMGNVDALHIDDCKLVFIILGINLLLFSVFYKEFMVTTFDPGLARALGFSTTFFNYLLMIQVSATVVGAFRAVGVLMVLAFITGPPLAARMLTDDLKKMLMIAMGIGCSASIIGVAITRHILTISGIALSTAGVVVCTIVTIYLITLLFAPESGLYSRWRYREQLKQQQ